MRITTGREDELVGMMCKASMSEECGR